MKRTSRRTFIQKSMMTATGIAISQSLPHILMPRVKDRLGVALVGLGYYSTDLLAPALALTQHCYLAGIVTGSPSKIPVWQKRHSIPDKNVYSYDNMHEIANNSDIDVIYIVLPPGMHSEYCVKAANAGRHVWCEKPMALTVRECEAAIRACKTNAVSLSIGYRMQHEANTQAIMNFGRTKAYGKITHVVAAAGYRDGRTNHWKQRKALGGGSMYDMGVYPLNAARYSTGEEPVSVSARASTDRPEIYYEVEEHMHFELRFPSGATASCETSFGKGMNNLRVSCEKGWYGLEPFQAYSGVRGSTSDGKQLNASPLNQQARQMDDDALAIMQGNGMLVPGEEGMRDIRVVEGIQKSVGLAGQWVTI